MNVHNLNGTSENKCKCGSWILHWEKISGKSRPQHCVVVGCTNTPEFGGHVQKRTGTASWFIIPICRSCNGKLGEDLEVQASTEFVSANKAETCEKVV